MKVALVRPFNQTILSITPPLGLGYIASVLREKGGHDVCLYDAVPHRVSSLIPFRAFLLHEKPSIVGIQVFSTDILSAKQYLACIKEINPDIITVIGGPHPSAEPEDTFNIFDGILDYLIVGEGEYPMLSLVDHIERSDSRLETISGLVWKDESGNIVNNGMAIVENLDELPWPDWSLIKPSSYPDAPLGGFSRGFPVIPVLVSRGCPMKCNFCAAKSIYGTKYRCRNIDDVITEIAYLKKVFHAKEILIQDDNITFRKKTILEFCEKISPLKIRWNCLNGVRLDFIDNEVAKAMKKAGCYVASVGIESGSQKILDDMNKNLKIEQIVEKISILKKNGIAVVGQFIIGYPTETREDIIETICFAKRLPIDRAAYASFIPLPGSTIYTELVNKKAINSTDLQNLSYYRATKSFTPHLSSDELSRLLKRAVRSFYLRPKIILYSVRNIGSFSNFVSLLQRFMNYI